MALDERLVGSGQWKNGQIRLNRSAIREISKENGDSVRRVLFDTAYHEAFHGFVEPIANLVSECLGVDDIYEASHEAMVYGLGRGYWYRVEEWGAEVFGRFRGGIRHRFGWR